MKIGFFITARLKSSRLKRKILLDLNGKSILDRVIERAKKVNGIDGVVLCTSTNSQDSELYKNALSNKIEFYAGSEDDVLKRLYDAARYYGYDGFLSITADNPLHSFYYGSCIIDSVSKNNFDFVFPSGLPLGIAPYYIRTDALDVALIMKENTNTEIWGPFVNRPDFFNICNVNIKGISLDTSTRLTCDYLDDYKLLRMIYSNFNIEKEPTIFEIEDLFFKNKKLYNINNSMSQIQLNPKEISKIRNTFDSSIKKGRAYIKESNYSINQGETNIII